MPNNTRSTIKNKVNQAEGSIVKAVGDLTTVIELYNESDLEPQMIIQMVQDCMIMAHNMDKAEPIQVYRHALRENPEFYLGRCEQHLFHIASILIACASITDSIKAFKIWETQN